MSNLKLKGIYMLIILIMILGIIPSVILATNEENKIQIYKENEKEYMIYIQNNMNTEFEFAFSNDKNADKTTLTYRISAKDSQEQDESNYVAYTNISLYDTYFQNSSVTTYLWARKVDGEYFIEGKEVDLLNAITQEQIDLVNNITKIIKVDTKNTLTTEEVVDDVNITKTVGKIDMLEKGENYYQFVRLPNNEEYTKFMQIAEKIAKKKNLDDMYLKLEIVKDFITLSQKLSPELDSKDWIKVKDKTILQPEDSKNGEQYIVWLKNEDPNKQLTKIDVQFLTCFEDYKPEIINEKVATKLPVTYDNPMLFIVLIILLALFIIVLLLRAKTNKNEPNKH